MIRQFLGTVFGSKYEVAAPVTLILASAFGLQVLRDLFWTLLTSQRLYQLASLANWVVAGVLLMSTALVVSLRLSIAAFGVGLLISFLTGIGLQLVILFRHSIFDRRYIAEIVAAAMLIGAVGPVSAYLL